MKNRLITLLRKKNRGVPTSEFDSQDDSTDESADPYEQLLTEQRARAVYEILKEILTPLQLDVWVRYVQGYTYAEISEELSVPRKKVDNAIMSSKKKIEANKDKFGNI